MSRSGYDYDSYDDDGKANLYRGNVERSLRGKRGQAFLKEMLAAMEALPEKRLVNGVMEEGGEVCAIASVGRARGVDMSKLDPEKYDEYDFAGAVARAFKISEPMAREIMAENDQDWSYWNTSTETPEQRYDRMVEWIKSYINKDES